MKIAPIERMEKSLSWRCKKLIIPLNHPKVIVAKKGDYEALCLYTNQTDTLGVFYTLNIVCFGEVKI